ncbi:MAG: PHB depolymerase family esterase [Actinomycetota bacterium]|nr:PHB depolymerase family esterase [Actinomycetota bacterium]
MNSPMQDMMSEATRLMQEGRLSDATAAIQRALGGGSVPSFASTSMPTFTPPFASQFASTFAPATERFGDTDEPTEAYGQVIDVPLPPLTDRPDPQPTERSFRRGSDPGRVGRIRRAPGKKPRSGAPKPTVVPEGGRFVERSFTNGAGTRAYKLYVPSGYTGQEVSLVVMLHGCTQDPDDFADGTRMNAQAEGHTFLVAYPQQGGGSNMQKCWNWFKDGDQHRDRGEPSIIAGITREVLGEYNVAPERVYVAGMSAGGAMAAIMGSAYPDLYAAIGVHSGLAPGAAHDLPSALSAMHGGMGLMGTHPPKATGAGASGRSVPLIVFHGDRDSTVHPRNAEAVISHYKADGLDGKATGPIKVRQGQVPSGHSYTRSTQHDADGRPVVEHWNVHGLGHAWSGGGRSGSYTDPNGPDASAEMVRFFQEQR